MGIHGALIRLVVAGALCVTLMGGAAAHAAPGDLDPTFASGGTGSPSVFERRASGRAVSLAPDSRIVVAGTTCRTDQCLFDFAAVARYQTNGSPDSSFGTGGGVAFSFPAGEDGPERTDEANDVLVLPDGKVLVAGSTVSTAGAGPLVARSLDFALTRLNPNGTLDSTFAPAVVDFFSHQDTGESVTVQPDGKIVVAGTAFWETETAEGTVIAVARFNSDGTPDTSLSGDGRTSTPIAGDSLTGNAVALQPDGKIVIAGHRGAPDPAGLALVRFNPDGALDQSFSGDGIQLRVGGVASSVVVQPDGKVVAIGGEEGGPGCCGLVARYNPNGAPDSTFSGDGERSFSGFRGLGGALDADGRPLVTGGGNGDFNLARLTPSGDLDTTFAGDGLQRTDNNAFSVDLTVQPDGRIVVAGTTPNSTGFALARYEGGGATPPPPDGDQDGVPDDSDACPAVPGSAPDGCPPPEPPPSGVASGPVYGLAEAADAVDPQLGAALRDIAETLEDLGL